MTLTPPAFCTDLTYPFSSLRMFSSALVSPGVIQPGHLSVSPGSGLQVAIAAGLGFVPQSGAVEGSAYDGLYFLQNDAVAAPYNTISAPISNPRIDLVVLRVYDSTELGISGASFARFEWVPGAENVSASLATMGPGLSNPGAAAVPQSSLLIAYVLQTVGESSISSGNILNAALTVGRQLGPWLPLTLVSCNYDTNSYIPAARTNGDAVELRGTIISTGSGINAALPGGIPLPSAIRVTGPGSSFGGNFFRPQINRSGGGTLVTVNDSGGAYGPASGALMTLDGMIYWAV